MPNPGLFMLDHQESRTRFGSVPESAMVKVTVESCGRSSKLTRYLLSFSWSRSILTEDGMSIRMKCTCNFGNRNRISVNSLLTFIIPILARHKIRNNELVSSH